MRVQTKLISWLLLLSVIFAAGRFLFYIYEDRQMYALFKKNNEQKNIYFGELVELKGANLYTLAYDYTYWDEMVDFLAKDDMEWAKGNLDENTLKTYQADGIWIYKTDGSLAYFINNEDTSGMTHMPLSSDIIKKIFANDKFVHFFINTTKGLMEVRGATIHPTLDPRRKTPMHGYFFGGRLWKKEYVDELSRLVRGKIEISSERQPPRRFRDLLKSNKVLATKELLGWDGKPLAHVYVEIQSWEIESYKLFSRKAVIIFIAFLFAVVIITALFLSTSVTIPFSIISRALKTADPDALTGLKQDTSEFGDISRLISEFFLQQKVLVKEIEERKKAEEKLRLAYTKLTETQDQLIQAEKLNAVGQLASGVAHEVRNPLGIILQGMNYLEKKYPGDDEDIRETIVMLKESVKRADKIINGLLDFSRASSLDLKPEDINTVVDFSLSLVKARLRLESVDIVKDEEKNLPTVLIDRNKIEQVFINLVLNAVQAMPGGGKIYIRTYLKELNEARRGVGRREEDIFKIGEKAVVVEVQDTGVGIPEENLKKVFDPFFTTKGSSQGAGLGLSVTQNIISMHKGVIDIKSRLGKGTTVIVIFKIRLGSRRL